MKIKINKSNRELCDVDCPYLITPPYMPEWYCKKYKNINLKSRVGLFDKIYRLPECRKEKGK